LALYTAAGGFRGRLGKEIDGEFLVAYDNVFGNDISLVAIRPRQWLSRHDLLSQCQDTFLRPRGLGRVFLFGLTRGK